MAAIDPAKMPANPTAAAAVLKRFPGAAGGQRMTERTARAWIYADGSMFMARPLAEAATPGVTMAQFWPSVEAGHTGDFKVTNHSAPGDRVRWIVADGAGPSPYLAGLAEFSGSMVFEARATSPEVLHDMVAGFAAAVR